MKIADTTVQPFAHFHNTAGQTLKRKNTAWHRRKQLRKPVGAPSLQNLSAMGLPGDQTHFGLLDLPLEEALLLFERQTVLEPKNQR
ncbi:MAG: hypothetical protein BWX66_01893 [Deltaproteobacteria bacterium ADurb.Bin058]|nr:MAG: hypothetical protein BWX66_01893 [Deltaproteobacteria bacterium ADurb.Bin058]